MTPAAYRNKREPKLVRRDPPRPDAAHLWEPLYPGTTGQPLNKAQAKHVLEALETLVVDTQIDFAPAYEGAVTRQSVAISIMRNYIKGLT